MLSGGGGPALPQTQTQAGAAQRIAIGSPLSAFGELLATELTPTFQGEFSAGVINAQNFITFTALNGQVTASPPLVSISSGTTVGGIASLLSRRTLRYKPGQGAKARFTAMFETGGVASSTQIAGVFTGGDGFAFGFNGTAFGVLHRRGGLREVQKLTITTASSHGENVTVALAGVNYSIAVTNSGNKGTTAAEIAAGDYSAGYWQAYSVHPIVGDPYVIFVNRAVGDKTGTFSLTGTSAVGSFAEQTAGVAVSETWVPQASWNLDTCDGSGLSRNPSGFNINTAKLNVYEIQYQYLGAGAVVWSVEETNTGRLIPVHILRYANTATTTHIANPNLRVAFAVGSLGSTTNLVIKSASVAAFVEGRVKRLGPITGIRGAKTGVGTSLTPVLSVRNPLAYNSRANFSEGFVQYLSAAVDGTKPADVVLILNPTLTGARFDDGYIGDTSSTLQRDVTATGYTGGRELVAFTLGKDGNRTVDITDLEVLLSPGDILMVAVAASAATTDVDVAVTITEEI